VIAFPAGFDPSRPWPILIVTSTSDFNRTSAMDVDWYRRPATAEGWIVLGSDATVAPQGTPPAGTARPTLDVDPTTPLGGVRPTP